jgi:CRISPR type III-A-associated protein Csm2
MSVDWNFLQKGYYETRDGEPVIRADLMSKHAEDFGRLFAGREGRQGEVSSSQLRAFYADAKSLETKIKEGGEGAFAHYLYLVMMLKSKASYVQGKKSGGRVSEAFRDYIHKCVEAIQTAKDFEAFMRFFESTVGFYYGYGGGRLA